MIKAVIIDDEEKARITLVSYLKSYCPDISVIAEADSVESGVNTINEYNPHVVFLDIMLSDGSAFNLLKQLNKINFKIIFVTSYNQYAIKAFKYSAFDYILKPIDIDELILVVERLKATITTNPSSPDAAVANDASGQFEFLENTMSHPEGDYKKLVLSTRNGLDIVDIDEIMHCDAQDNYTMFYLANGTRILVPRTLKDFEQLLQKHNFIRTHKSHLVNFKFISKFSNQDGGSVVLKDGSNVPVSTRKKDFLIKLINDIGLK